MHQYLSIDIGGTEIKSALIDHSGRIIRKDSRPTPRTQGDFLAVIDQLAAANQDQISAVCVSVPGIVAQDRTTVQFPGALTFMGTYDLGDHVEKQTGLPVYVGNDANCASLAELWLGGLQEVQNGAVITLGTSVGGGLVINGRPFLGSHFQAGELGALINNYDAEDPRQATAAASGSAVKMVTQIAQACGLPDLKDGRRVFQEIKAHNSKAWPIFEEFCRRIAGLIVSIQSVVDLEKILIGGGISAQPIVIKEIRHQFDQLLAQDRRLRVDIVPPEIAAATFGNEANLLGALYGHLLRLDGEE